MTAAVYRNATPSLSIPQTQNTAPVLEFNCLYTHDLRRKAKRWQDGFLRYHTFNRRIMVYDVPRNYIGDSHWTGGEALQDGDEVMLDMGGVMVQVAEAVGRTETDLTDIRKSRKKDVGERGSSPPARGPQTPATRTVNAASRPVTQLKHRSLNALLGTPKGPIGKAALPAKSPFELRHEDVENHGWEEGRPPKRPRMQEPAAKHIARPPVQPLWARTTDAAKQKVRGPPPAVQRASSELQGFIDLVDDEPEPERFLPGFSSDALVPPSSPPRDVPVMKPVAPPAPAARSSSPGFQTQKPPENIARKEVMAARKAVSAGAEVDAAVGKASGEPQRQPPRPKERSIEHPVEPRRTKQPTPQVHERPEPPRRDFERKPSNSRKGATLRIASGGQKKGMLLCQDQLAAKPKHISSTNTDDAADALLGATNDHVDVRLQEKPQRRLRDERMAKTNAKKKETERTQTEQESVRAASPRRKETGVSIDLTDDVEMAELDVRKNADKLSTKQPVTRALPTNNKAGADLDTGGPNRRKETVTLTMEKKPQETTVNVARPQDVTIAEPEARPKSVPSGSALELAKLDAMISAPGPAGEDSQVNTSDTFTADPMDVDVSVDPAAPKTTIRKMSPKKKKGVGRREIRASAQSCFPEAAARLPRPTAKPLEAQMSVSEIPAVEESAAEEQAAEQPVTKKTVAQTSAAQELASAEKPEAAQKSAAAEESVAAKQQAAKETAAERPFADAAIVAVQQGDEPPLEDDLEAPVEEPLLPEPPKELSRPVAKHAPQPKQITATKPKRTPGAPMRFTPSPQKLVAAAKTAVVATTEDKTTSKPTSRFKKPTRKAAVRLNTATSGTAAVLLARPFAGPKSAAEVKERAVGPEVVEMMADPWSREAFDLFDYRPPGWDEEGWCFREVAEAVEEIARA
ncbi:hypothetical protein LTR56_016712 [Elasticomyces elasticus]|nr:hypothetical protein LTR56_016712 [Elasticomyces elasticus]KAK3663106.1 hypothetical protein LTR22_006015 [Elasticomyces elasticus]KAK4905673.1 hypothetical protein LTR49_025062 [Elasticomyces elasticus]KAK5750624.1 hypothetical protein LTS12_019331 [Elasticomyces elasticus]